MNVKDFIGVRVTSLATNHGACGVVLKAIDQTREFEDSFLNFSAFSKRFCSWFRSINGRIQDILKYMVVSYRSRGYS